MDAQEIELEDLKLLARSDAPDLNSAITAFLEQPDPAPAAPVPAGALTADGLRTSLLQAAGRAKPARQKLAQELWTRFLSQPDLPPPPRFQLPELLLSIYEQDSPAGRGALLELVRTADLRFGLWGGLKRLYKLVESRGDAEFFGALAFRFDVEKTRYQRRDVSGGTLTYLRRRAWRYLRQLAQETPELYPQFAAQVLRHYDDRTRFRLCWVVNHIWAHNDRRRFGKTGYAGQPPADLVKHRAFDDAWKQTPDALMLLVESCGADAVARFAIQGLRRDFPEALRAPTAAWLARLGRRPLASVHEFLIETLAASPEFHQAKLKGLGLHETVLALLLSPSPKARAFAIEYARAHGQDLSPDRLCELLAKADEDDLKDLLAFAGAQLKASPPRKLGLVVLGRLLRYKDTRPFAEKALSESFERKEIPEAFLIDMLFGEDEQRGFAEKYIAAKYPQRELHAAFWRQVLDDKRLEDSHRVPELATKALSKYPLEAIGADWLLLALVRDDDVAEAVAEWLGKADALPGLDLERLKGLIFDARYPSAALEILANQKLVKPRALGLPWLLGLARRSDAALHEFAQRTLLMSWRPADFAPEGGGADAEAGVARLFHLATGDKEQGPVRTFAQTYLRCHHPVIGPEQPESKALHIKPQLPAKAYGAERLWPSLADPRPDVRRFALAIARVSLRGWGYLPRVYELGESDAQEVRRLCYDALLKAPEEGEGAADLAATLKVEELDAGRVFAMSESRHKTTREVGLELIRRHYGRLGGAERLGWLMESPDREVRLCAVRLLWEKHRPQKVPPGWQPKAKDKDARSRDHGGRFGDAEALRSFLRRILFGVPPGRSMEPGAGSDGGAAAGLRRRLPASVAKRNVIAVVRDLGAEDEAFAELLVPVLYEFTGALGRTEWQACLSALVQLQKAHPALSILSKKEEAR